MKKLLVLTIASLTLFSCSQTPEVNYECSDYITKKDWKVMTNKNDNSEILFYNLDHKILLNDKFPSSTDSTKVTAIFDSKQFGKLPQPTELHGMIYKSLLNSHSSCKHKGTFKPYEINLLFMDGDSTLSIKVDFLASNAYGTPGELHGTYLYDTKTYKLKNEFVTEY
jgi:hypothetical protein